MRADGKMQLIHRMAVELDLGRKLLPRPHETVDHTCHNADKTCPGGPDCPHRACFEITHLEVTDLASNWGKGRLGAPAQRRNLTHCPAGHPYSGTNLTVNAKTGARRCLTCHREREARRRAAHA